MLMVTGANVNGAGWTSIKVQMLMVSPRGVEMTLFLHVRPFVQEEKVVLCVAFLSAG